MYADRTRVRFEYNLITSYLPYVDMEVCIFSIGLSHRKRNKQWSIKSLNIFCLFVFIAMKNICKNFTFTLHFSNLRKRERSPSLLLAALASEHTRRYVIICWSPLIIAQSIGVRPDLSALWTREPCSIRNRAMLLCPFHTAERRGVNPFLSDLLTFAPFRISSAAVLICPLSVAAYRGLSPISSTRSTLAPRFRRSSLASTWPYHAARRSAERPCWSCRFTEAP